MTDDPKGPPVNDNLSGMVRQAKPAFEALNMAAMVFAAWGHPGARRVIETRAEPEPEVVRQVGTSEHLEKKETA